MTKRTSYKISKELEDLGFEADTGTVAVKICEVETVKFAKSYDLETIIDALPESILSKTSCFEERLELTKGFIMYKHNCVHPSDNHRVYKKNNESLVNMAARLLIKLIKNKTIKLKNEN